MQVEEIVFRGKKPKKDRRISLLNDYYYQTPSSEANQNAGFALVHQFGDTKSNESANGTHYAVATHQFHFGETFPEANFLWV